MHIGIIGATGAVGQMMLTVLNELEIKIDKLELFASKKSAGKKIRFRNEKILVQELNESAMKRKFDYLLFSAGSSVSSKFAPIAAENGNTIIDNSSAFRKDSNIPLVVPEVNASVLDNYQGIVANPNCSTIQMVLAISDIHQNFKITKIIVSTYQAVSGAGFSAINTLLKQRKDKGDLGSFPKKIDLNVIPQIGNFQENGYTFEEEKMEFETRKILNDKSIKIAATTVRVPVINGHSESIYLECEREIKNIETIMENAKGVKFHKNGYITALDVEGSNYSHVCRLRRGVDNYSIKFWNVAHNLRVGAATNAIKIMLVLENRRNNGRTS